MLFRTAVVTAEELARVTGWHVRPEGLCREDRCVPFGSADDAVDLAAVARAIGAAGVAAAGPWIAKANATHPSLIDRGHVLDALFGIVNVPSGVWIDESGTIVRPPEPAHPRRPAYKDRAVPADVTPEQRDRIETVRALNVENERYVGALRDWVSRGAKSRYALTS